MKDLNKVAKFIIWGSIILLLIYFVILPKTTFFERIRLKIIEKNTTQLEEESERILNDINETLNELEDIN